MWAPPSALELRHGAQGRHSARGCPLCMLLQRGYAPYSRASLQSLVLICRRANALNSTVARNVPLLELGQEKLRLMPHFPAMLAPSPVHCRPGYVEVSQGIRLGDFHRLSVLDPESNEVCNIMIPDARR